MTFRHFYSKWTCNLVLADAIDVVCIIENKNSQQWKI